MDLAVITVSYNTRDLLANCLESVLAGLERSGLAGELWVVDNASADGSTEMVQQRFPQVKLVAHNENLGFAAGNNLALSSMGFATKSSPRHVLFLNPDTLILGDALGALVSFLDSTPRAGAAGARLQHGDGSFQHSAFAFPGLAQVFFDLFPIHHRLLDSRLNGRYTRKQYTDGDPFPIDHPLGAALMVRGETLAQVGGFDERFFMYCEEIDLCQRIKKAGWQIYCVPRAEIVHLVAQSTRQFRDRMYVALWQSRFLLVEKHHSRAYGQVTRGLVRVGLWAKSRQAKAAHRRGDNTAEQMEGRLAAYREVAAL